MIVCIYSRISKSSSDNLNQLILLRNYCQKMDYTIYGEYVDVVSGTKENRPQFDLMIKDASKRKFDMVLFFALDRLTRQGARMTIHYLQMFDSFGVSYKSYTEEFIDTSGIFKDVVISLLATLASQESIKIGQRIRAGLQRSKLQGIKSGRPTLDEAKINKIRKMKTDGMSIMGISKSLKISRGTIYNYL